MGKQLTNIKIEGDEVSFLFNGTHIKRKKTPKRIAWVRHGLKWRRPFRCESCYLRQSGGCGCCSENVCVGCGRQLFSTALNK